MSEDFENLRDIRERSITYKQLFSDIMRLYNISKDQLEDLLDDKKTVDQLFEKNDKYTQADNKFARMQLPAALEQLKEREEAEKKKRKLEESQKSEE